MVGQPQRGEAGDVGRGVRRADARLEQRDGRIAELEVGPDDVHTRGRDRHLGAARRALQVGLAVEAHAGHGDRRGVARRLDDDGDLVPGGCDDDDALGQGGLDRPVEPTEGQTAERHRDHVAAGRDREIDTTGDLVVEEVDGATHHPDRHDLGLRGDADHRTLLPPRRAVALEVGSSPGGHHRGDARAVAWRAHHLDVEAAEQVGTRQERIDRRRAATDDIGARDERDPLPTDAVGMLVPAGVEHRDPDPPATVASLLDGRVDAEPLEGGARRARHRRRRAVLHHGRRHVDVEAGAVEPVGGGEHLAHVCRRTRHRRRDRVDERRAGRFGLGARHPPRQQRRHARAQLGHRRQRGDLGPATSFARSRTRSAHRLGCARGRAAGRLDGDGQAVGTTGRRPADRRVGPRRRRRIGGRGCVLRRLHVLLEPADEVVQRLGARADRQSRREHLDGRAQPPDVLGVAAAQQGQQAQAEEAADEDADQQRPAADEDVAIGAAITATHPRCDQQLGHPLDGEGDDEQPGRRDVKVRVDDEQPLASPDPERQRADDGQRDGRRRPHRAAGAVWRRAARPTTTDVPSMPQPRPLPCRPPSLDRRDAVSHDRARCSAISFLPGWRPEAGAVGRVRRGRRRPAPPRSARRGTRTRRRCSGCHRRGTSGRRRRSTSRRRAAPGSGRGPWPSAVFQRRMFSAAYGPVSFSVFTSTHRTGSSPMTAIIRSMRSL